MKVSDFIEWLKTQDQDAVVRVMVLGPSSGNQRWEESMEVPFNPANHVNYTDFRVNPFAKGIPCENDRYLTLGHMD